MNENLNGELTAYLQDLHLPAMRMNYRDVARQAEQEAYSYEQYLHELATRECAVRRKNRTERLLRESELPPEKTLACFDMKRLPQKAARQVKTLLDGTFLDRKENVMVFGIPGVGKTHLLCAMGMELIHNGRRILFTTCSLLVQELLKAKRELRLARYLKQLSKHEGLIIDEMGYVQQSREEMEVLFTLLAERYERGSVLLTSNLAFSKWESIFKDPMTTAAAIDRLVHHSVIIELNIKSYRVEDAKKRQEKPEENKEEETH